MAKGIRLAEYACAQCGETFTSAWSDEEARAEYEAVWEKEFREPAEKKVVLCDPCYRRVKAWKTPKQYQAERKAQRRAD